MSFILTVSAENARALDILCFSNTQTQLILIHVPAEPIL